MAENARALLHAHYETKESQLGSKAMPFVPSAIPNASEAHYVLPAPGPAGLESQKVG